MCWKTIGPLQRKILFNALLQKFCVQIFQMHLVMRYPIKIAGYLEVAPGKEGGLKDHSSLVSRYWVRSQPL